MAKVKQVYLVDVAPVAPAGTIAEAEWDEALGVLRVGDVLVPMSMVRQMTKVPEFPTAGVKVRKK